MPFLVRWRGPRHRYDLNDRHDRARVYEQALAEGTDEVSLWRAEPLPERVGRIVAALLEAEGFALAGGAALVVTRRVDRVTRDLDFFGPTADDVDRLLPAVESALVTAGLTVRRERVTHGFARLTVVAGDEPTALDLAADARIRRVDSGPLGPMVPAEEFGADKLLVLFDRREDAGFSRSVLVEMLGSFGRFRPEEFEMPRAGYEALARTVERWRHELSVGATLPGAKDVAS